MEPKRNRPIGIFDSGIGGLTVLNAVRKALPHEKLIYYGDTARLPYGDKSPETILRYSIENSIFLMDHWIKVLVIACNTASSVAASKLRQLFNIPVIGVIEPGAERAVKSSKNGRIAVLGTKATIQSRAYEREILTLNPEAHIVPIACPLFVPFIEEGMHGHPAAELIVREYLKPLISEKVDTVLLGCTHYLALKDQIDSFLEGKASIVDSATTCAERLLEILRDEELFTIEKGHPSPLFYASDNPEKFELLGKKFLDESLTGVKLKTRSLQEA